MTIKRVQAGDPTSKVGEFAKHKRNDSGQLDLSADEIRSLLDEWAKEHPKEMAVIAAELSDPERFGDSENVAEHTAAQRAEAATILAEHSVDWGSDKGILYDEIADHFERFESIRDEFETAQKAGTIPEQARIVMHPDSHENYLQVVLSGTGEHYNDPNEERSTRNAVNTMLSKRNATLWTNADESEQAFDQDVSYIEEWSPEDRKSIDPDYVPGSGEAAYVKNAANRVEVSNGGRPKSAKMSFDHRDGRTVMTVESDGEKQTVELDDDDMLNLVDKTREARTDLSREHVNVKGATITVHPDVDAKDGKAVLTFYPRGEK